MVSVDAYYTLFQSTRPRGARHGELSPHGLCENGFNPRAREGRDVFGFDLLDLVAAFQSTRPRGARQAIAWAGWASHQFQSTRPRGARHVLGQETCERYIVSIHAPARGATPSCPGGSGPRSLFQSTRPRGARPESRQVVSDLSDVSIHAPARGATCASQIGA